MPNKDEIEAVCEQLEDEATRLSGISIDRGSVDAGIASNLASEAATMLRTLAEENTALRAISIGLGLDKEEAEARAIAAEEERDALREALAPFAHAAFEADGYPDSEPFTLALRPDVEDFPDDDPPDPESLITARQLRLARTALAQKEGG